MFSTPRRQRLYKQLNEGENWIWISCCYHILPKNKANKLEMLCFSTLLEHSKHFIQHISLTLLHISASYWTFTLWGMHQKATWGSVLCPRTFGIQTGAVWDQTTNLLINKLHCCLSYSLHQCSQLTSWKTTWNCTCILFLYSQTSPRIICPSTFFKFKYLNQICQDRAKEGLVLQWQY